jgi:hypothetical protein
MEFGQLFAIRHRLWKVCLAFLHLRRIGHQSGYGELAYYQYLLAQRQLDTFHHAETRLVIPMIRFMSR